MKIVRALIIGFLLTLFSSGCSSIQEETVKLIDQGYIVEIDQANHRLLVTQKRDENEEQQLNAAWLKVNKETSITNTDQQELQFEDLHIGWMVEVSSKGSVAESFPVQAEAAEIVVKANGADSTAISKALAYLKDTELKFIQQVSYDQQQGVWAIIINEIGSSHLLYVNQTGKVVAQKQSPDPKPEKEFDSVQSPEPEEQTLTPSKPPIVAENEAFRIFEPKPNTVVGKTFSIKGEARVFEAVLSYYLEDGHNVLAKGHVQASKGAPEWGSFEIEMNIDQPTSPSGVLIIFEESAKDGSPTHQLYIPVKFEQ